MELSIMCTKLPQRLCDPKPVHVDPTQDLGNRLQDVVEGADHQDLPELVAAALGDSRQHDGGASLLRWNQVPHLRRQRRVE
eukprot:5043098-Alexandrium_andersonii.AAC.1